jgi:hypothetical protein
LAEPLNDFLRYGEWTLKGTIFAVVCVVILLVGFSQQSIAQAAPGVFADANQPSGPPDPEKLDSIWQVDPISGQVNIKIPFETTPVGERGPKIPFSLSYNSASTLTMQSGIVGIAGIYYTNLTSNFNQTFQWCTGPFNSFYGPAGPWNTSGPFMYDNYLSIPNQEYSTGAGPDINDGQGCTIWGPYIYTDEGGESHDMNLLLTNAGGGSAYAPPCQFPLNNSGGSYGYGFPGSTLDGSAIETGTTNGIGNAIYPDGTSFNGVNMLEDTNGNESSRNLDSLGRTPFSTNIPIDYPGQIPVGTYYVTTTGATGNTESYSVVFSAVPIGSFTMPHPLSSEISQQETWCINGITYPEGYEAEQASPGTTLPAVTSIARPDGTAYTFQYDPTYGTISQITFPDGGYVKFVWGILANVGGYGQFGAISSIAVTEVITAAASGASESIWQYNISPFAAGQPLSSSVIAPDGSYTNYTGIYMSPYSLLIGSQRSRRDLLIEGKLPARNRRLRVVERELPQGFDMGWIGNGCSCFRRRGMFSDDHTFDTDNDPMISITDEDCLSGVFRGKRVAALLKAHEAIETGLARKHLLQRIRRNAVECR